MTSRRRAASRPGASTGALLPMPRLLTARQAAAYLGYASTAFLARIPVRPRSLLPHGLGSQPKYDRVELDAWLDGLAGLYASRDSARGGGCDEAEAAYERWRAARGAG